MPEPPSAEVHVDLAAMREDAVFGALVRAASQDADPKGRELVDRLERIDLALHGGAGAGVYVLRGRLPDDPNGVVGGSWKGPTSGPSGARTFRGGDEHLWVLPSGAWVGASDRLAPTVEHRLRSDAALGVAGSGALVEGRADGAFVKAALGVDGVTSVEFSVRSKQGVVARFAFEDASAAARSERSLGGLVALLRASRAPTCEALESVRASVNRDGRVLELGITGLELAAERWDPATCPKLGGERERSDEELMGALPPDAEARFAAVSKALSLLDVPNVDVEPERRARARRAYRLEHDELFRGLLARRHATGRDFPLPQRAWGRPGLLEVRAWAEGERAKGTTDARKGRADNLLQFLAALEREAPDFAEPEALLLRAAPQALPPPDDSAARPPVGVPRRPVVPAKPGKPPRRTSPPGPRSQPGPRRR